MYIFCFFLLSILLMAGCQNARTIINDVDEREANEIIVFLAGKDIAADKILSPSASPAAAEGGTTLWSIVVDEQQATEAMAVLNQNGLPRRKGTSLLTLFAKSGFMQTDKEETIRYQAGLAEQIASTIRKIDGVIDADVQLSFPVETAGLAGASAVQPKVTAAVYVKHQGVLDDPNGHLVNKIKRLVSSSVTNLDVNDVTVISDRSRFTDVSIGEGGVAISSQPKEYVSIWSIVMNKDSTSRFRFIFFTLTICIILFGAIFAWVLWKFYPILKKKGGWKELFHPVPIDTTEKKPEEKQ